ncbi:MauE/DoxX family redox-associated membrane protein [Halobacteriovorax sp. XZX-3]|uniref:hypothetical protein n=1 Tax=unclassified Halobacteriovorax TaxID=2639665 RepID=UPI003717EFBE
MCFKKALLISRYLLAITYLWVVADRLSLLGPAGNMGVVWGDFDTFLSYTASLNPWFPKKVSYFFGYIVTIVEVLLAVFFIFNVRLKETFLASFILLVTFTFSMIFSVGFEQAYDFIIFTVILALLNGYMFWRLKRGAV